MIVEPHDLFLGILMQAVATADSIVSSLCDLFAAGASRGVDYLPLGIGGGTALAAGGAAAAGGGSGEGDGEGEGDGDDEGSGPDSDNNDDDCI